MVAECTSAPKAAVKLLDAVYHLGLWLATGAFCTSPIESLHESDGKFACNQRACTSLLHGVKTSSVIKHPSNILIHDISSVSLFVKRPSLPQPYAITVNTIASYFDSSFKGTSKTSLTAVIAPWKLSRVSCDMSFASMCVLGLNLCSSKIVTPRSSTLTGEAEAIALAIEYILQNKIVCSVLYTDSLSVGIAVSLPKPHNAAFNLLINTIIAAYSMGLKISRLCPWSL